MDWWNPIDDVNKFLVEPVTKLFDAPGNAIDSWLSSIGGQIASGLERGMLSWVNDVWRTILPAVQIIAGVVIIILAGMIAKDSLGSM